MNNFNPTFVNRERNEKLLSPIKCLEKDCTNDDLINKSVDLDKILNILNSSSTSSSASSNSKTSNVLSLFNLAKENKEAFSLADFINSVKFSTSEPNLSNQTINQSSTNSNKNTTNRCSLLRKSISFNKDEEDLDDLVSKIETTSSDTDSKKENLNEIDELNEIKIDPKLQKDPVSNGKIFNQVKYFCL